MHKLTIELIQTEIDRNLHLIEMYGHHITRFGDQRYVEAMQHLKDANVEHTAALNLLNNAISEPQPDEFAHMLTSGEWDIMSGWMRANFHNQAIYKVATFDDNMRIVFAKLRKPFKFHGETYQVVHGEDARGAKMRCASTIKRIS